MSKFSEKCLTLDKILFLKLLLIYMSIIKDYYGHLQSFEKTKRKLLNFSS
jgi:hypothetical protein